jgi:protein involved in polysaccharide export with SLBB domain
MYRACAIIATLGFLSGCASTDKEVRDPTVPVNTYKVPFDLAVLDQIHITLPDGYAEVLTVDQDGIVVTPSGPIEVAGIGGEEAGAKIRKAYPQATKVEVREFRGNRVSVLGEVFHQIHTDLGDSPMRVMDAIAAANGFTPLANKRRVRLLRENAGNVEIYELDLRNMMRGEDLVQNFLLEPGDVITVPKNFL